MKPDFRITGTGGDLTKTYAQRLASLQITDNSTEQADTVSIELSNHDGKLPVPAQGEILTIAIGYEGNTVDKGQFVIDQISLSGFPERMTLSGKAAPFAAAGSFTPFQSRKSRSFDDITLGQLVTNLAAECGLIPGIAPQYYTVTIPHLDQTNESNMNLLTRLARDYEALMKPTFGRLLFLPRSTGASITGAALPGPTITKSEVASYSADISQRTRYGKATARWHDPTTGETKSFSLEGQNEGADYEAPHLYPDEAAAKNAAKSILKSSERGSESITLSLSGRPDIIAEGLITLTGFPAAMNKSWTIKTVTHSLSPSGFTTSVQAEIKDLETPSSTSSAANNPTTPAGRNIEPVTWNPATNSFE